jgi:hypothetical protein
MSRQTSRLPEVLDIGTARTSQEADHWVAYLKERSIEAHRRGRTLRAPTADVHKAATTLREGGAQLRWAPAPEFQESGQIEWPLVLCLVVINLSLLALLIMIDNLTFRAVIGLAFILEVLVLAGLRTGDYGSYGRGGGGWWR